QMVSQAKAGSTAFDLLDQKRTTGSVELPSANAIAFETGIGELSGVDRSHGRRLRRRVHSGHAPTGCGPLLSVPTGQIRAWAIAARRAGRSASDRSHIAAGTDSRCPLW